MEIWIQRRGDEDGTFTPTFKEFDSLKIKPPEVHCLLAQMKNGKRSTKH